MMGRNLLKTFRYLIFFIEPTDLFFFIQRSMGQRGRRYLI